MIVNQIGQQIATTGAEHVVYETIKLLEIDKKLVDLGLKAADIAAVIGVLCGRMIVPGSERSTHYWLQNLSALGELIDFDFSLVTLDRLYKASDHLMKHKEKIEDHLRKVEVGIFALEEKIILYDLTNTFFEGTGKYNPKAKYGRSKEKRSDCPLVTLGLVLDMQGFPKRSRIFEGNVSEPSTLETMINGLSDGDNPQQSLPKPTVAMDAGIASEDNVQWLRGHNYRYIVVSRKKKVEIPDDVKMALISEVILVAWLLSFHGQPFIFRRDILRGSLPMHHISRIFVSIFTSFIVHRLKVQRRKS